MVFKRLRLSAWIVLCIVCMTAIYFNSETPAADQKPGAALGKVFLFSSELLHHPILFIESGMRDAEHIMEYILLTLLVLITLRFADLSIVKRAFAGLLIALLFSCLDEWHQLAVIENTKFILNAFFDLTGILLAVFAYCLLRFAVKKVIVTEKNS